jgi:glycosyltransferase involved in cell wall biosynthesis
MRILHIISGLETGGAEIKLLRLLEGMDASRFTSAVVSLRGLGTVGPRIEQLGIPVFALGMRRSFQDVPRLLSLRRVARRWRPDLIQTWMYHANLAGLSTVGVVRSPRLCWSLHACEVDFARFATSFRAVFWLSTALSRLPDAVFTDSYASRRWHESVGYRPGRWECVPNAVDPARFRPDARTRNSFREQLGVDNGTSVVGLVANWMAQKDHRNFLTAIALLRRRFPQLHAVLAGRGMDGRNPDLLRLTAELGLNSQLHLLGERRDVPDLMNSFDICCLSSCFGESGPTVLIEAMACGVPCVATDVGDSAYIIGDTGLVVRRQDPEALAATCTRLLEQDRQLLGCRARKRAQELFSVGAMVRRYEDIYGELCRSGQSASGSLNATAGTKERSFGRGERHGHRDGRVLEVFRNPGPVDGDKLSCDENR